MPGSTSLLLIERILSLALRVDLGYSVHQAGTTASYCVIAVKED